MLVNNYTPTYITDWQESVLDKDLTAPPGSPTKGDRYIVGVVATGDWSGEDNNITEFNGSVWRFTTANEGMITWVEDENKYYIFDGSSWNVFGASLDHSKLTKLDYASAGHTGFLEDTIDKIKELEVRVNDLEKTINDKRIKERIT